MKTSNGIKILAIETSCDETAIAVLEIKTKKSSKLSFEPNLYFRILSNIVSSQVKIHAAFGGVVPNLAKREHQKNLIPVLIRSLRQSGLSKTPFFAKATEGKQNSKLKKPQTTSKEFRWKRDPTGRVSRKLQAILEREPELLEQTTGF